MDIEPANFGIPEQYIFKSHFWPWKTIDHIPRLFSVRGQKFGCLTKVLKTWIQPECSEGKKNQQWLGGPGIWLKCLYQFLFWGNYSQFWSMCPVKQVSTFVWKVWCLKCAIVVRFHSLKCSSPTFTFKNQLVLLLCASQLCAPIQSKFATMWQLYAENTTIFLSCVCYTVVPLPPGNDSVTYYLLQNGSDTNDCGGSVDSACFSLLHVLMLYYSGPPDMGLEIIVDHSLLINNKTVVSSLLVPL